MKMDYDEKFYRIALSLIKGIGSKLYRKIVEKENNIKSIFYEDKKNLKLWFGSKYSIIDQILNHETFKQAEKEIEFALKYDIKIIDITNENYPNKLKDCYDAPSILYLKGNENINSKQIISIVGTRSPTSYGLKIAEQIVDELKNLNVIIISGLALGVDQYVHQNALKNKIQTYGILGHGLNQIYPQENKKIANKMIQDGGGLITEFTTKTIFNKSNFPKRNRIIAGISDATIVVESKIKGGSMITANLCFSYNKLLFAVPGKITDVVSQGCNYLIKSQKALIYTGINDLKYQLSWEISKPSNKIYLQKELFENLSKEELEILKIIEKNENILFDELSIKLNLSPHVLNVNLIKLELNGLLKSYPGKTYRLE